MNSGPKVLLGALAGAAIGAVIAGIFTEEGNELREKVVQGSKDFTGNLKEKLGDATSSIKDAASDAFQTVKQTASDFVGTATDKASSVASNLK
jgi:gas vesicle protein